MPLPIHLSENSREPIYHQIERQIMNMIAGGQLPAGTPLPSIRSLANDLSCSVITTRRVYQNLEIQGYIKSVQGKGTFVSELSVQEKKETIEQSLRQSFYEVIQSSMKLLEDEVKTREVFESVLKEVLQKKEHSDE